MNKQQEKKRQKLADAAANAEIEVARATKALEAAGDDTTKKAAAEEALKAAETARDEAAKAHEDYKVQLETSEAANRGGKTRSGSTVTVTATRDRRRAGIAFAKNTPVDIDLPELDEDQIKALEDDPALVISKE